jgi:hypothetical protein
MVAPITATFAAVSMSVASRGRPAANPQSRTSK